MNNEQMIHIIWTIRKFKELSTTELYKVLQLRQKVFVVEQNCAYQDCDNKDQSAHHLLALDTRSFSPELVAYLRLVTPQTEQDFPYIGRVLCHPRFRKNGIGA